MSDEFGISKTIVVGSQGGKDVGYNIHFERLPIEINGITFDEIVRLNTFLTEYVKEEQNNENK